MATFGSIEAFSSALPISPKDAEHSPILTIS